jgi:hypothetical protein
MADKVLRVITKLVVESGECYRVLFSAPDTYLCTIEESSV